MMKIIDPYVFVIHVLTTSHLYPQICSDKSVCNDDYEVLLPFFAELFPHISRPLKMSRLYPRTGFPRYSLIRRGYVPSEIQILNSRTFTIKITL
jgi:hypothetical protein